MIAAAAAKPMTVLRIVLTPLLLEKPQPSKGNTAIPVVLPRAAIGVRGGRSPWSPRNLLLDHKHGGLYGVGTEPAQGFLVGVTEIGRVRIIIAQPVAADDSSATIMQPSSAARQRTA